MSKTGPKYGVFPFEARDAALQVADAALVPRVLRASDEPQVSRRVIAIHVDAIKFEIRVVPAVQRDEMCQEPPAVAAPRDGDPSPAVVREPPVARVETPAVASRDAVEKSGAMALVGHDIGVAEISLPPLPGSSFRAPIAAR